MKPTQPKKFVIVAATKVQAKPHVQSPAARKKAAAKAAAERKKAKIEEAHAIKKAKIEAEAEVERRIAPLRAELIDSLYKNMAEIGGQKPQGVSLFHAKAFVHFLCVFLPFLLSWKKEEPVRAIKPRAKVRISVANSKKTKASRSVNKDDEDIKKTPQKKKTVRIPTKKTVRIVTKKQSELAAHEDKTAVKTAELVVSQPVERTDEPASETPVVENAVVSQKPSET